MFSNYKNENILGKSKCGCSNTSPINVPSSSMKLEFVPVYNPSGSQHYIPLLDKKKKSVSFIPNEIIDTDSDDDYELEMKDDLLKTFYIGSITVVGLYIIYRLIEKRK
jgi:hypothetical protein